MKAFLARPVRTRPRKALQQCGRAWCWGAKNALDGDGVPNTIRGHFVLPPRRNAQETARFVVSASK